MELLIDGDEVIYRVGFQAQKKYYFCTENRYGNQQFLFKNKKNAIAYIKEAKEQLGLDFDLTQSDVLMNEEDCIMNVDSYMQDLFDTLQCYSYRVFLSSNTNFRDNIATIKPYKGNRENVAKPFYYDLIKNHLINEYFATSEEGLEADDLLGLHSHPERIIISQDKDLRMIPGYHFDNSKRNKYYVEEEDADLFFFTQLLSGDSTDNIPGLYGFGISKAIKLLNENLYKDRSPYQIVYDTYKTELEKNSKKNSLLVNSGKTIGEILDEIGSLLWIKRRNRNSTWKDIVIQKDLEYQGKIIDTTSNSMLVDEYSLVEKLEEENE